MELDELIFLGACSILSRHPNNHTEGQTAAITGAVKISKRVWEEVMEKRKEDADGNS
jgi:hypothetical protein